jgi:very-long-chain enoyl-CoA reductase
MSYHLVRYLVSLLMQATVDDLKSRFAELKPKYYPSRQRWTLPTKENTRSGEVLTSGKKLSEYGIKDGVTLQFKDLGPQIGYATVFFWEYFGPLVIYPLFYFLPSIAYAWHT